MSQFLPYLLILVCPLTMGLMMWVMMRGMGQGKQPDPRVAELESQLNDDDDGSGQLDLRFDYCSPAPSNRGRARHASAGSAQPAHNCRHCYEPVASATRCCRGTVGGSVEEPTRRRLQSTSDLRTLSRITADTDPWGRSPPLDLGEFAPPRGSPTSSARRPTRARDPWLRLLREQVQERPWCTPRVSCWRSSAQGQPW